MNLDTDLTSFTINSSEGIKGNAKLESSGRKYRRSSEQFGVVGFKI
jgi:hypothetical protein